MSRSKGLLSEKVLEYSNSTIFVKELYEAYQHILQARGIIPMHYDDIHNILHEIMHIDHTGRRKPIITHLSTDLVITADKYARISFICRLYDQYKSINNSLWIYTDPNKYVLPRVALFILALQVVEIAIILLIIFTMCNNYTVYLIIARASATMILLNSLFLLVHISNITQYIDSRWVRKISTNSSGSFHKLFGFKILLGAGLHTMGHFLHINHILNLCESGCTIEMVHTVPHNVQHLTISWKYFLSQPAYYTGIILIVVCLCIVVSIIMRKFNLLRVASFYNVHKILSVLLFLLIVVHGMQQLLGFNLSYIFVLPMLMVYLYSRRFELFTQSLEIFKWHITDNIVRLYIINSSDIVRKLEKCIALSVYINHPKVSKYEWHPFTLTLGMNKYEGSLNIKNTGKWTQLFIDKILQDSGHHVIQYINIGHITPSCFRFYKFYTKRVFFCSGIGITPFLTVMSNVINNYNTQDIFIWSIGDVNLIKEFQTIINGLTKHRRLQIFIFYSNSAKQTNTNITTDQWNKYNFLQTLIHYHSNIDIVHGVSVPIITILNRINSTNIMSRIINQCENNTDIGVFVCGGASYTKAINESIALLQNNKKNITLDLWTESL